MMNVNWVYVQCAHASATVVRFVMPMALPAFNNRSICALLHRIQFHFVFSKVDDLHHDGKAPDQSNFPNCNCAAGTPKKVTVQTNELQRVYDWRMQ